MSTARYATRADVVRAAGGAEKLVQVADHNDDGVEDDGLVNEYICDAEAFVDTYWRRKFEVTPATVPRAIKRLTAKLVVYNLKSDGGGQTITEREELEHEQHIGWLKDLAAGKVDPGINPSPAASPLNVGRVQPRPSSKKASREKFKGFT